MARRRTEAAEKPPETVAYASYTVDAPQGLYLRAGPSKRAAIIRVLAHGETVTERGTEAPEGWLAVNGGYVMRDYLK